MASNKSQTPFLVPGIIRKLTPQEIKNAKNEDSKFIDTLKDLPFKKKAEMIASQLAKTMEKINCFGDDQPLQAQTNRNLSYYAMEQFFTYSESKSSSGNARSITADQMYRMYCDLYILGDLYDAYNYARSEVLWRRTTVGIPSD